MKAGCAAQKLQFEAHGKRDVVADFDGGRMTSDGGGLLLREANCCLGDLMADVLPVDWIILYEGGGSSDVRVALYDKPNWAEGFDVVIHNECYANVADEKFIRQITSAHETGVPAILIHCAMHSYRAATVDDWREFAGSPRDAIHGGTT